jgi:hypothetical protein
MLPATPYTSLEIFSMKNPGFLKDKPAAVPEDVIRRRSKNA